MTTIPADTASLENDKALMQSWLADRPDTSSVGQFVPGPGFKNCRCSLILKSWLKR